MDPLGNQPAQPNPQPPVTPVPPAPAVAAVSPTPEVARPTVATPPVSPNPERPVESWPPAGTQAAVEAEKIAAAPAPQNQPVTPSPQETQTVGAEVAEAAGAAPTVTPAAPSPGTTSGMDGFVSPVAKEIKDSVNSDPTPSNTTMSDQQADQLFKEEPATKERNKKHKVKKIIISLLTLIVILAVAAGAYIFIFGNKAAQSYVNTSNTAAYKESFSQIETALGEQPVDSAELEAGFKKLKVASSNYKELEPIVLGSLNPNYKRAMDLAELELSLETKAKAYATKYADYTIYLKSLSDSFAVINEIEELKDIDLTVTTAEKITTDLTALVKDCAVASKTLTDSTKPADLSDSSKALQDYLVKICTGSADSLQNVPLVFLTGKTGILNAADQTTLKGYFNAYKNLVSLIAIASSSDAKIEDITSYQQSALEDASTLLQEADTIINS